ncbi:hypothetical protein AB0J74_10140 [Asanoa sp. NPDC049573]|uniref:hypothetical protein n=1 Tax=Asanoa sp. NPDC049573 TaxID=3155396 RepID=UPI00342AB2C6
MDQDTRGAPAPTGGGARRYLIASAVTRFPKAPRLDRPELVGARDQVVDLFTTRLGYQNVPDLGLDPTRDQLLGLLNAFCRSSERKPDDLVAVYLSTHGEVLDDAGFEHVLLLSDTDPDNPVTALPTVDLARAMLLGTRVRRVLIMLDTCYSGQGGQDLTAAAVGRFAQRWGSIPGAGFVVLASARPNEAAYPNLFPTLLRGAVTTFATAGAAPETLDIGALVQRMNVDPARPPGQRVSWNSVGLSGTVPGFFPNANHNSTRAPAEVDRYVAQVTEWQDHAERRELDYQEQFLTRARADLGMGDGWWFTGRHSALTEITAWLTTATGPPAIVVTGDPGSGKTAILGLVTTLSHSERRRTVPTDSLRLPAAAIPQVGAIDVAVYAGGLTNDEVLAAVAAAVEVDADTPGALVESLAARIRPCVVLVDALDEAIDPHGLITRLLLPLLRKGNGRIRLLLGTRPHLAGLISGAATIHLDSEHADPAALRDYTVRVLMRSTTDSPFGAAGPDLVGAIAERVVAAAGNSFLVAGITGRILATAGGLPDPDDPVWLAGLPRLPGDAMAQDLARLGVDAGRARDLLLPLAFAQGQGLPWEDVWSALASRLSNRRYTDEDLLWLRRAAGSYVVETQVRGRSVYRLFHVAMAGHLRTSHDAAAVNRTFVEVLTAHAPRTPDWQVDWAHTHPYTLRNLASHAAAAGMIDGLAVDAEFLTHAAPDTLIPALRTATGREARLAARTYLTSAHLHRAADVPRRRQLLALDTVRLRPAARREPVGPVGELAPRWATSGQTSVALHGTLTRSTAPINAVACALVDGRPVAVTGSYSVLTVWDLRGEEPMLRIPTHQGDVTSVACTVVAGRPVALSTGSDSTTRMWDLRSGQQVAVLAGHLDRVWSVACTEIDGRPVAVTGSTDRTVRIWDLAVGANEPEDRCLAILRGHSRSIRSVACTTIDDRAVAVTVGWEGTGLVWELDRRLPAIGKLSGHLNRITAVACATIDGRPVAVTGSLDRTVRVWDLSSDVDGQARRSATHVLAGHAHRIWAVATTEIDGRPVAVTGGTDRTVRLWDLRDGGHVATLTGHTGRIAAVAATVLDGRPVAVTGNVDRTARVWDLGAIDMNASAGSLWAVACTVVDGRPVAVTGGTDRTVRTWDAVTGDRLVTLTGHADRVTAVSCAQVGDATIAVTGGRDGELRFWDLRTGACVRREQSRWPVWALACTVVGRRTVAVTGDARGTVTSHDLQSGRTDIIGEHERAVWAVTCSTMGGRAIAVSVGDDHRMRVWDLERRTLVTTIPVPASRVWAVRCISVGGERVAVTACADGALRAYSLGSGAKVQQIVGHTASAQALATAFVDHRPMVASASLDGTVRLWDLSSGRCAAVLADHRGGVWAVDFAHTDNGALVVSAGDDRTLHVNDPAAGPTDAHTNDITAIAAAAPDGRPVVITGAADRTMRFWDLANGHSTSTTVARAAAVTAIAAVEVDGRPLALVATTDQSLEVWDLIAGSGLRRTALRPDRGGAGHGGAMAIACAVQDGRPVAVVSPADQTLRLWDLRSWQMSLVTPAGMHVVTSVDCVPTTAGLTVVTGGTDGTVQRLVMTADPAGAPGAVTLGRHSEKVTAVACAIVDGRPFVASLDAASTVHIQDLATGDTIATRSGPARVTAMTWSTHAGRPALVLGSNDGLVRVCDPFTLTALTVFQLPEVVHVLAPAPDGSLLVGSGHEVVVLAEVLPGPTR